MRIDFLFNIKDANGRPFLYALNRAGGLCSFFLDKKGTEKIKARIIGPRYSRPKTVILRAG
jgi:hypothetical protein